MCGMVVKRVLLNMFIIVWILFVGEGFCVCSGVVCYSVLIFFSIWWCVWCFFVFFVFVVLCCVSSLDRWWMFDDIVCC